MGYDMEMESYHEEKEIEEKELEKLKKEILDEAKKVVEDYTKNPSQLSGSLTQVHEDSPALDTEKDSDEPLYSGSRWTHVIKTKI